MGVYVGGKKNLPKCGKCGEHRMLHTVEGKCPPEALAKKQAEDNFYRDGGI